MPRVTRLRGYGRELGGLSAVLVVIAVAAMSARHAIPLGGYGQGVVAGASLALYAAGIVLIARNDGFVNLAHVQVGALAATLFATLVQGGTFLRWGGVVCPPCFDHVGGATRNAAYLLSLIVSLGVAAATGWLIHALVARRLRDAPVVVPTVATVFVVQLLAGVQGALPNFLLTKDQRDRDIVSGAVRAPVDATVRFGGALFHLADILTVVLAVVALAGLVAFLARSSTGRHIRAASDNRDRAQTLAIDVNRVGGRVWALAGLLSGTAAILGATNLGAKAVASGLAVTILVRILAVAVVARFASVLMAGVAALTIGVLDATVSLGFGTTLPVDGGLLIVITALLLIGGRSPETRAAAEQHTTWRATEEIQTSRSMVPAARTARRAAIAGGVIAAVAIPWLLSASQTTSVTVAGAFAIVGLSVLVLTGWAGQLSLGQFAFAAVGAWVAAVLHLPLLLALPAGAAAGGAAAVLVGLPALRLRGLALAVSTLAFALSVTAVLLNPRYLGQLVPPDVRRPSLLGLRLDDARTAYYVGLVLVGAVAAMALGMRRSAAARAMIAARDNERAAQSAGINLVRTRLLAFAIAGGIAAVGGVWFSVLQSGVPPEAFAPERSINLFVYAVIGGLGSVGGPLLGFAAYGVVSLLSSNATVISLAGGIGGLAVILAAPRGLVGILNDLQTSFGRRVERRAEMGRGAVDEQIPIAPPTRTPAVTVGKYALEGQWGVPHG